MMEPKTYIEKIGRLDALLNEAQSIARGMALNQPFPEVYQVKAAVDVHSHIAKASVLVLENLSQLPLDGLT